MLHVILQVSIIIPQNVDALHFAPKDLSPGIMETLEWHRGKTLKLEIHDCAFIEVDFRLQDLYPEFGLFFPRTNDWCYDSDRRECDSWQSVLAAPNRPNFNTRLPLFPSRPPHILPFHRKKHVSTLLNIRGMMRQAERQEILNVVKDFECSTALMCRDHALFSDIPITSEVHCISLGLLRLAMTVSNWLAEHRPRRRPGVSGRNTTPQPTESQNTEDTNTLHRED